MASNDIHRVKSREINKITLAHGHKAPIRIMALCFIFMPIIVLCMIMYTILHDIRHLEDVYILNFATHRITFREILAIPAMLWLISSGWFYLFLNVTIANNDIVSVFNDNIYINSKKYIELTKIYKFDIVKMKYFLGYPQDKVRYLVFTPFEGEPKKILYVFREKQEELAEQIERVTGIKRGIIEDPKS